MFVKMAEAPWLEPVPCPPFITSDVQGLVQCAATAPAHLPLDHNTAALGKQLCSADGDAPL